MAILETLLPHGAVFGLTVDRAGPIRAEDFETWAQEPENPLELIAGWVLPMSPGTFFTGEASVDLAAILRALGRERGWRISQDARHRLPLPSETTVFPDLVIHCTSEIVLIPRTKTVSRVPDLVIELLSEETVERDRAPHGAKFLAYQMSGVREYYYAWPDGRDSAGFRLENGLFVPIVPDAEGYFASPLLEARLRLVPAGLVNS